MALIIEFPLNRVKTTKKETTKNNVVELPPRKVTLTERIKEMKEIRL